MTDGLPAPRHEEFAVLDAAGRVLAVHVHLTVHADHIVLGLEQRTGDSWTPLGFAEGERSPEELGLLDGDAEHEEGDA